MKWYDKKRERYQSGRTGIKGRKNGNIFEINDYDHLGWWVFVEEAKSSKVFNSLWSNLWWKNIEEAKKWCEDFKWENIN